MIGRITAMIRFARCRKFLFQCISIGVILAMVASACLFKLASIQLIDGQMAAQAIRLAAMICKLERSQRRWKRKAGKSA